MFRKLAITLAVVSLTGCMTIKDSRTGEVSKLTLSGLQKLEKIDESKRKSLPSLSLSSISGGFIANGVKYFDPAANIVHFSASSDNGLVTYSIHGDEPNQYIIKQVAPLLGKPAKVLGTLKYFGKQWHYQPKGDKQYSGDDFVLFSDAVLITRRSGAVTYMAGNGEISSSHLPNKYKYALVVDEAHDTSVSKHVALLRPTDIYPDPILGFKLTIGGVQQFDIALYNIETGEITAEIKKVKVRGNSLGAQLENLPRQFRLVNTPNGALSVSLENSYQHYVVRNLATGEQKIAFEREYGISYPKITTHDSGRVELKASLGFTDEVILDIENFILTGERNKLLTQ